MNDLEEFFSQQGFVCYKITLKGHGKEVENVQAEDWTDDILTAYNQLPADAPKFFCGFSLGCLSHHIASLKHQLKWDFSWYISPALQLKWIVYILKIPCLIPSLKLPSFAHEDYKAHKWLPCRYYKAMFKLNAQKNILAISNTRILMSPKDEVISFKKTTRSISKDIGLTSLRETKKRSKDSFHLIPPYALLKDKDREILETSIKSDFTF